MKKGIVILVLGLVAAAAAYGCVYFVCTASARTLQQSARAELAWLKEEFNLSEAEFKRVSELHEAYLPQCREMCIQIDAQDTKLQKLLAGATNISPEIERGLAESSRMRTECQTDDAAPLFPGQPINAAGARASVSLVGKRKGLRIGLRNAAAVVNAVTFKTWQSRQPFSGHRTN